LVVDDDPLIRFLLQIILEAEGHEARSARDGRDGYSSYLLFQPDVVMTDLRMPLTNGLELMKQIRRHNPGVKTVYMSADPSPFEPLLEEEKGRYPVTILQKPFSRGELMGLLSNFADDPGGRGSGGSEGVKECDMARASSPGSRKEQNGCTAKK
jgi:DNA-binding NtrC family response regulator